MKITSWNVNGIRAVLNKDFIKSLEEIDADIVCLQEIKANQEQVEHEIEKLGYKFEYWFSAEKKGYSGVATFSKIEPMSVTKGIGEKEFDDEGRVLTLEFKDFYLLNIYFPNAQPELKRIDFKIEFDKAIEHYVKKLEKKKPVILTGDFNVAHEEIDLKNPKANEKNAGFSPLERKWFDSFLKEGYVDTFRQFEKGGGHYTWWTYRFNARANNIGWRIDYFVVSQILKEKVISSKILNHIHGSDHCPISLEIKI